MRALDSKHNAGGPTLGVRDPAVTVSTIIVSWNTHELLLACLRSLEAQNGVTSETTVVDNGSRDGSAEAVAAEFPAVLLVRNGDNRGFAAANNQGLRLARGRYVLLLNSDTIVPPGTLAALTTYMDAHPAVGALGPRLLNADGSLQSSARDFPRFRSDALAFLEAYRWPLIGGTIQRYMLASSRYGDDHRETQDVDWLMGACLLLRREALEIVGGLDEGYFFFSEEMDLCYRLRRSGWTVAFYAGAEVVHLGGQSSAQVPARRLVWHYAGALRFYQCHRGRAATLGLRIVIILAALVHIAGLLLRRCRTVEARQLLSAYGRVVVRALT